MDKYIDDITNIINDAMSSTEKTGIYWQSLIRKLKDDIWKIETYFAAGMRKDVETSYRKALSENLKKLRSLKSLPTYIKNKIDYTGILNADRTRNTINNIVNGAINDFNTGLETNTKKLVNWFNGLQQENIKAAQAEIEPTQQSIRKAIRENLKEFANGNKFITIIDVNGKPRNYNISKYAKMVAEYKVNEAHAQSSINTSLTLGSDLVQVDFHNTICDICAPLEGKIYSISGKSTEFPKLDFGVPLHPNCYHTLNPIFREVLEIRGIDNYIKFSNGNMPENEIVKMFPSYKTIKNREGA